MTSANASATPLSAYGTLSTVLNERAEPTFSRSMYATRPAAPAGTACQTLSAVSFARSAGLLSTR